MELSELIALAAGVLALSIAIIAFWRSGQPLTLQTLTETFARAGTLTEELREVAEIGVMAAQQLKETGDIQTNQEAFQHAFAHVQRWYEQFGGDQELDAETIANFIEGAYWLIKQRMAT